MRLKVKISDRLSATLTDMGLSLLSALLLASAWFGFSSLPLLVGFVPLLFVQQRRAGKRFMPFVIVAFVAFNLMTVSWVAHSALIGTVAATLTYCVLFGAVMAIYNAVWKRALKPLAYTILVTCWTAAERLYLNGEISFPWLNIGGGFATDHSLVQWYEYTGTLGGTLWAWIVNLTIFETLSWTIRNRRFSLKRWIAPLLWIAVPISVSLFIYNKYEESERRMTVTVLQPNVDPYGEKFGGLSQREQLERLLRMVEEAPSESRFIIAPETALDNNFWVDRLEESKMTEAFRETLRRGHQNSAVILGLTTYKAYPKMLYPTPPTNTSRTLPNRDYWWDAYNSAVCIEEGAPIEIYHKSKLVIGVEMIPYHEYLTFLNKLSVNLGGISGVLATQPESSLFETPEAKVGCAICYESVYGEYFASFVRKGAQTMFVITNDGWWDDTMGYRQHLRFSKLRAIETRRSIARSANTGISALINERGDIVSATEWDEETSLSGEVTLSDKTTLFVEYGDIVGRASTGVFALSILYFFAYRRRKKDYIV